MLQKKCKIMVNVNFLDKKIPLKIFIEDLQFFEKLETNWIFKSEKIDLVIDNVNEIHIQGKICKTSGLSSEIFIIDDETGKAKITRKPNVPGNFKWLKAVIWDVQNLGETCSVVGTVVEKGKLPHIDAIKIARLDNENLQKMWPWEVSELKDLMTGKIFFAMMDK